jgi:tryptophan synthase beta chain
MHAWSPAHAHATYHDYHRGSVCFVGVEAAGFGVDTDKHAATLTMGTPGVLHGSLSYLIQDSDGQVIDPHSISAGLDYPGVGPEHAFLKDAARAEYHAVTDAAALEAFQSVSKLEGIIPALETSHALAYLKTLCAEVPGGTRIVVNFSGRGDKDVTSVMEYLGMDGA